MSKHNASDELQNREELSPDVAMIIEIARQHYVAVHGCEPLHWESIFDHEPPSDVWSPVVLCSPLLMQKEGQ